jgi:hypothetical protein
MEGFEANLGGCIKLSGNLRNLVEEVRGPAHGGESAAVPYASRRSESVALSVGT